MGNPVLNRAAERRKDTAFLEARLQDPESLVVPVWRGENLLRVGATPGLVMPRVGMAAELLDGELVWLGLWGRHSCFAADISALPKPDAHPALAQAQPADVRRLAGADLDPGELGLAAYARGILYWHSRNGFCGACGEETAPRDGGHMRVCRGSGCQTEHFPRTDPAVIVLVTHGDRCLLGRQAKWPRGMYSTLAGFVEPGESLEQAVVREIREEAGVDVTDVRYLRSQPWPFPASLMLGFTAVARGPEIRRADDELEDVRWFSRQELQAPSDPEFFVPGTFSLSGQLLELFLGGHSPSETG